MLLDGNSLQDFNGIISLLKNERNMSQIKLQNKLQKKN